MIFESLYERHVGSCFSLSIPLWLSTEEIDESFHRDAQIKLATKAMLDGRISIDELLELVEDCVPDMDDYMDGVENNLIHDGLVNRA